MQIRVRYFNFNDESLTHHILAQEIQLVTLELVDLVLEGVHLSKDRLRVGVEGAHAVLVAAAEGTVQGQLVGRLGGGHGL